MLGPSGRHCFWWWRSRHCFGLWGLWFGGHRFGRHPWWSCRLRNLCRCWLRWRHWRYDWCCRCHWRRRCYHWASWACRPRVPCSGSCFCSWQERPWQRWSQGRSQHWLCRPWAWCSGSGHPRSKTLARCCDLSGWGRLGLSIMCKSRIFRLTRPRAVDCTEFQDVSNTLPICFKVDSLWNKNKGTQEGTTQNTDCVHTVYPRRKTTRTNISTFFLADNKGYCIMLYECTLSLDYIYIHSILYGVL